MFKALPDTLEEFTKNKSKKDEEVFEVNDDIDDDDNFIDDEEEDEPVTKKKPAAIKKAAAKKPKSESVESTDTEATPKKKFKYEWNVNVIITLLSHFLLFCF